MKILVFHCFSVLNYDVRHLYTHDIDLLLILTYYASCVPTSGECTPLDREDTCTCIEVRVYYAFDVMFVKNPCALFVSPEP